MEEKDKVIFLQELLHLIKKLIKYELGFYKFYIFIFSN